jgi:hypothetical protein
MIASSYEQVYVIVLSIVYEICITPYIIHISIYGFLSNNKVHNVIKTNLKDKRMS